MLSQLLVKLNNLTDKFCQVFIGAKYKICSRCLYNYCAIISPKNMFMQTSYKHTKSGKYGTVLTIIRHFSPHFSHLSDAFHKIYVARWIFIPMKTNNDFKGTVSRDFLYPVFFINQFILVPLEMSMGRFIFFGFFIELLHF